MKLMKTLLAATALVALMAGGAAAKQLVYCSEGSPEGFDPSLWSAGTTFDASARAVYSRLVDFELGGTEIVPSLAETWDISEDGTEITFHLRQDVKWQTTAVLHPDPRLHRRRRGLVGERQVDADASVGDLRRWRELSVHRVDRLQGRSQERREGRRLHRQVHLQLRRLDGVRELPDGLPVDRFGRICRPARSCRQHGPVQHDAGRHRPVPVRRLPGRHRDPLRGQSGLLEGQGEDRRPDLRDHPRARRRDGGPQGRPVRRHPVPGPGRPRSAPLEPRPRRHRDRRASTSASSPTTRSRPPFDKPEVRQALNMAVNKEAILEGVYSGQAVLAINPIPASSWASDPDGTIGDYNPEKAKEMLAAAGVDRPLDEALVDAGCASLQPERQAYGRAAAGRLERHRRQRRARSAWTGRSTSSSRRPSIATVP